MKSVAGGVFALCLCAVPGVVAAESASETAEVFGARQSLRTASLSPSGSMLAYIASTGTQGETLYVVDLANGGAPKRALAFNEPLSNLRSCSWITEGRLLCNALISVKDVTVGEYLGVTRLFALNADGSDIKVIESPRSMRALGGTYDGGSLVSLNSEKYPDSILLTREYVKEDSRNTRLANDEEGLGIIALEIESGKERKVEAPDKNAIFYIADDAGSVRVKGVQRASASGYLDDQISYLYRQQGSDRWLPLSRAEVDSQTILGFEPLAVDSKRDVAYGFEVGDGGFANLYAIRLDGSEQKELLLTADGADIDELIRIGRKRRVVGASFATEKRQVAYFDKVLGDLAKALAGALPGKPQISFVGASEDESKLLLVAGSDTDPGMLYLFDRVSGQLNPLVPLREETEGRQLAKMSPVSFPAADGTEVPAYLTLPAGSDGKNLPAIVLPHGGPSARDEWGFDWLVQFFAARGYAVLQPNYRGSSGYGAAWFGRNGFQAWKTAVGDINDAGRWLVAEGIAEPGKLAIAGWSYGGYAALQSQALDADLYKAVVAIAPVTDLARLRQEERKFAGYRLVSKFIGEGPHVREGSPAENASQFKAPVLLVHGTADQNVDVGQSRLMADQLRKAGKNVDYLEFDELAHGLDDSEARKQMLVRIDAFLASALGS